MSKFEILHKCVRHKTTDLKFCIRFVRGWSTKRRIFCAVFWICSIIVLKRNCFYNGFFLVYLFWSKHGICNAAVRISPIEIQIAYSFL